VSSVAPVREWEWVGVAAAAVVSKHDPRVSPGASRGDDECGSNTDVHRGPSLPA
jgi:hypothetical protein